MAEEMSASELLELKLLPAWVKEASNEKLYADFAGEDLERARPRRHDGGADGDDRRDRGSRFPRHKKPHGHATRERAPALTTQRGEGRRAREETLAPDVEVFFLPDSRALESVLAQIKAGHVAYSVFSLSRMFLERPERYDVRLKTKGEPLFQLGDNGPAARDEHTLERAAFPSEKENFYRMDITQTEPIKGNFTSVARCRLSGQLLGPTNYHAYQAQLRTLYERRFSRRMNFSDYQRQIQILNDPAEVERWKEEARSVTTYTTLREEPPRSFHNIADAERHFRQNYLPGLLLRREELTLDGVVSRALPDRALGRTIEQSWSRETRAPSKMMQELIGALRRFGLHLFRHRKGGLFVSPVRQRPFRHERTSVSATLLAILEALAENPGINRKVLLEKLPANDADETTPEIVEKRKLALAADLHWLISEGHVIEFNDGSLEVAREKIQNAKNQNPEKSQAPTPAEMPSEIVLEIGD